MLLCFAAQNTISMADSLSYHICCLFVSENDRYKRINLLLKIFSNIINNPTNLRKYGQLNRKKIIQFEAVRTDQSLVLHILLLSGFSFSQNDKRLIWENTANNMTILTYIYHTLHSIFHPSSHHHLFLQIYQGEH